MNSNNSRIDFLDAMRVFAFISVLVGHKLFAYVTQFLSTESHLTLRSLSEMMLPFFYGGAAGVVVFFLTSGYIITHVLQKESATDFLVKRFFRIYPLFICAVFFEIAVRMRFSDMPFPPWSELGPRLLLVGDFTSTGYALGGVDWTLRIEVMFYLFVAVLKSLGLLKQQAWLPLILVIAAATLFRMKPLPHFSGWSDGYCTLYAPFLFIGVLIYLVEHRLADRKLCIAVALYLFLSFLLMVPKLQPQWKESNYAVFALILFLAAWRARSYFRAGPLLRLVSNITFPMYLLHNWLWEYLTGWLSRFSVAGPLRDLQTVVLLLLLCYVAHRSIENFGIRAGRYVLRILNNKRDCLA